MLGVPTVAARPIRPIREKDLQRWRLIERFQSALATEAEPRGGLNGTWGDPERQLKLEQYLSLFLFGLFNPVVESMRGLCEASKLERVQREVCGRRVSLGSFSEAQAVVDPALLKAVLQRLVSEADTPEWPRGCTGKERIIDSSVWQVLPRMAWAFWRRPGGLDNAVRLHVALDVATGQVSDAKWVEESSEILTAADRAAGVAWASVVRLGKEGNGPRGRVIAIPGQDETILVATTLPAADFPPELIAHFYKQRWQVELFFRWLKCILGCRHWLAESEAGVALQVYLALIAAQLLVLYRGERPNRRQMEAIQFYLMGWATLDELLRKLRSQPSAKPPAKPQKN